MSQYNPTVVEVTARTDDQIYQGTTFARTCDRSVTATDDGKEIRALSAMGHLCERKSLVLPWILAQNQRMFSCRSTADEIFAVS